MIFLPEPSSLFGPGEWVSNIDLRQNTDGERLNLGREFDELTLKYGQPGTLRGYDHRGEAFMEIRQLDFATLPLDGTPPKDMERRDYETLMRLIHTPQHVLIHASGGKYSKPVTGKWIRASEDHREYARLMRLPILGKVHE